MTDQNDIPKVTRRFSKNILIANMIMAWALIGMSLFTGMLQVVLAPTFGFMTALIGIYAGVGHMDYRQSVRATRTDAIRGMQG